MSDDDRIADYLARMEDSDYRRDLTDGCPSCRGSLVYCRASRYLANEPCCSACSGH